MRFLRKFELQKYSQNKIKTQKKGHFKNRKRCLESLIQSKKGLTGRKGGKWNLVRTELCNMRNLKSALRGHGETGVFSKRYINVAIGTNSK